MAGRGGEWTFAGTSNLDRLAEIPDLRHREAVERAIDLGLEAADSVRDRTISTFSRGYQPAFAGIGTFLKAPYLEDVKQVGAHDVAIVGAPFDMGRRRSGRSPSCTTATTSTWPSTWSRSSTSSTSATSS